MIGREDCDDGEGVCVKGVGTQEDEVGTEGPASDGSSPDMDELRNSTGFVRGVACTLVISFALDA